MDRSGSRFPPLTESELAALPELPVDVGWVPIVPVPQGVKLPRSLVDRMCPPGHSFCARWPYTTPDGGISSVIVRYNSTVGGKKEFRPFTYCRDAAGRCEWQCQALPEPRPLYNLDQFVAHDAPVLIVEGEKSADAAALIFQDYVVTTNSGGAKAFNKADWSPLAGRDVSIWPDHDEPGAKYANGVAALAHKAGASMVRIVAVPDGFPAKWDLADRAPEGADVHVLLDGEIAKAPEPEAVNPPLPSGKQETAGGEVGPGGTAGNDAIDAAEEIREDNGAPADDNFDLEIVRLAKLPVVDYERTRKDAASKLGVRAPILDRLVAAQRPGAAPGNGRHLELATPEPWPEFVNGAALVTELTAVIRKYVALTENDGLTVALWVLHSYCFDTFPCTPRLAITAPEKRCGKTTLLDVIALLVPKALATANISAAATFRTIEVARPTLLIDEADTFLGENEELRGILNSGHRAGGQVIRTVGDDFEARSFSTHCPVAIAQIGKLPDTLADRSIHISMKRLAPGETVARFRLGRTPELVEVAMKAARWVPDNADAIRECDPAIPDAIFNRAADKLGAAPCCG